jgi:hypothetical protein
MAMAIRDKSTGILIEEGLVIHHINLDETNNSPDNLIVLTQAGYERLMQSLEDSIMALEDMGLVTRNSDGDRIADEEFLRWYDNEGKAKYEAWANR